MAMPIAQLIRTESERCPKLRVAFREEDAWRHHSNDRMRLSIERYALADDVWNPAKLALPKFVAEEDDVMIAERLLLRAKVAAEHGPDSEQRKNVGR